MPYRSVQCPDSFDTSCLISSLHAGQFQSYYQLSVINSTPRPASTASTDIIPATNVHASSCNSYAIRKDLFLRINAPHLKVLQEDERVPTCRVLHAMQHDHNGARSPCNPSCSALFCNLAPAVVQRARVSRPRLVIWQYFGPCSASTSSPPPGQTLAPALHPSHRSRPCNAMRSDLDPRQRLYAPHCDLMTC